uniref:WD_REPEATS_REGION domain-containing protein n=1 Tax=Heterorhabditis bacteriophora TaxID=37862 RepID=A0A1I7XVP1_HETBA
MESCKRNDRVIIRVFDSDSSHVYGILPSTVGLFVFGERRVTYVSRNELNRSCVIPTSRVAFLFTCNTVVLYNYSVDTNRFEIDEITRVQSVHTAVLLKALLIGDSWDKLITIVGTVFGDILIARPSTGSSILRRFRGHTGMIFGLMLSDDKLFSISDDRSLRVWNAFGIEDIQDGEIVKDFTELSCVYGHCARPFAICRDDGGALYTGGMDQTVCKWYLDGSSLVLLAKKPVSNGAIRSLYCKENNLYVGSENGGIICMDISTMGDITTPILIDTCSGLRGFARSGNDLYTVNYKGHVYLNGSLISNPSVIMRYLVNSLGIDNKNSPVVLAYGDSDIAIYHGGKCLSGLLSHNTRILSALTNGTHVFVYTLGKIGFLYTINGEKVNIFHAEPCLSTVNKTKPLVPSCITMGRLDKKNVIIIGSTSGHLLYAFYGNDEKNVEFVMSRENLLSVSLPLSQVRTISPALHRGQIIFVRALNLLEKDVIVMTASVDHDMVFSQYSLANNSWNELLRFPEINGYTCIDVESDTSDNFKIVTGGEKGSLSMRIGKWKDLLKDGFVSMHVDFFTHPSNTRIVDLKFVKDSYDGHLQFVAACANGTIDLLNYFGTTNNSVGFQLLANIAAPNNSMFTQICAWRVEDAIYLNSVSTSGKLNNWKLDDSTAGFVKINEIGVDKCGLSSMSTLISDGTEYVIVGSESGKIIIFKIIPHIWEIRILATICYHAATVTGIHLTSTPIGLKIRSISLDCRLAEHDFCIENGLCSFVRSIPLGVWDPAAIEIFRFRYPFYDQQTGTAQRLNPSYYRLKEQRYYCKDPNTVLQYAAPRWRRKGGAPSDAIEMKMFLRDNPALDAAVNSANHIPTQNSDFLSADISNDSFGTSKGTPKPSAFEFNEDLDEDLSGDDGGSDEDDWAAKRKGRKSIGKSKKKASDGGNKGGGTSSRTAVVGILAPTGQASPTDLDEKRNVCTRCGAKYKSLAGLSYHNAYVHNELSPNAINKLLSTSVEVSDFCDLCLGSRFMNKSSKKPEELVTCHDCGRSGHPSCLSFNQNVSVIINRYGWQCIECKSCTICGTSENDDQLLFCDDCDRGYHLYCLRPPLKKAPDNEYSCRLCQAEFGSRASAPAPPPVQ